MTLTQTVRRPDWRYLEVDSAVELLARRLEDLQPRPIRRAR